jgi:acetyl-CoA acetyltransferase
VDGYLIDAVRTPFGRHRGPLRASGGEALVQAARAVASGDADRVIAGGVVGAGTSVQRLGVVPFRRVVVDAGRELRRRGGGYPAAAACVGVGQGFAMVISGD